MSPRLAASQLARRLCETDGYEEPTAADACWPPRKRTRASFPTRSQTAEKALALVDIRAAQIPPRLVVGRNNCSARHLRELVSGVGQNAVPSPRSQSFN